MIAGLSKTTIRSSLAATMTIASLVLSTAAPAQEPSLGSADLPVVRAVAAVAAPPRITSIQHRWTGDVQEEFRLDIRFSRDVEGFTVESFDIFGADAAGPISHVSGSERNYFVTMNTWPNHQGPVIMTVRSGAATDKTTGERSSARTYTFAADNRAPQPLRAEVVGNTLLIAFDEDLDEGTIPSPSNFVVFITRAGEPNTERVSRVEIEASDVTLTLSREIHVGDDVEVVYDDVRTRSLRDRVGNIAKYFELVVANNTHLGEAPGAPRSLTATADGVSAIELDWRAPADEGSSDVIGYRIEVSGDGGDAWSTLARSTASAATRYRHAGLAPNTTRHYRVFAINSFDEGAPSNVASATTGIPLPDAPRGMSARAGSASTIELDWTAPATVRGAPVTGYRIETSTTGRAPWRVLEADTRSSVTTHTHGGLSPGATRHYRVAAINRAGRGPWSNVASATTDATVPGAPTGLRVAPGGAGGTDRLLLSWTPPASDGGSEVTGYRIEVSPNGVSGWTILVAGTGNAATTFSHTGLAPGTTRHYRVAALNGRGRGAYSNVARGVTNAARPGQPRNPRARAAGPTSITLTWERPASDGGAAVTGYRIRAHGPTGTWITIRPNTGSAATSFTHTGLEPATRHRYQVAAINRVGAGAWSGEIATVTDPDLPRAPTGLAARAAGTSRIDLSWTAPGNTGGAPIRGYRVEVSDDGGATWRILRRATNSAATTFSDLNLDPATTRHYRVAAINIAGVGPFSNAARATTEATPPDAPRGLGARADGTSRIELSWRPPASDGGAAVTGYRIEVSDDAGVSWQDLVANTRTTTTTHAHTGLEPATTRHYRVSAINRIGRSDASAVASATTDATVPDAPTALTATATAPTRIDLAWTAPAYDGGAPITGYRIEVSETGAAWAVLEANTGVTATTHAHTGLKPGSMRHYRVAATNRAGTGTPSNVASAATDDPVDRAGRLNTRVLPHVAAAMTSSTVSAIASRVDAVANGMGMERSVEANGLSSMAASLSAPGAGAAVFGQRDRAGLFGGTSFTMPLGNTTPGATAPQNIAPTPLQTAMNPMMAPTVREGRQVTTGTPQQPGDAAAPQQTGNALPQQATVGTPRQAPTPTPQQAPTSTQIATWGAGEYHYLGEPGATALDWSGSMVSAHVGVDARIGSDILAGVAGSYNSGSFDFTDKTGASAVTGTYGATFTTVSPYLAWFSGARGASVWGSAGIGRGDIEVDDEREGLRTSPASTLTGAAGGSYQLLTSGIGGVRLKAEGWTGRFKVEGAERIEAVTLEMQRAKLALELTQGFRTDTGHEMAFVLEGGMRYDDGDGVNGTSGEVGGGLRYTNARVGLIAEGRGRFVLSARDGYEEWGLGGMLMFDPAVRGQGLSIRVAPSWGDAASGVNQLWERGVSDAVRSHRPDGTANIDGEVAYGIVGLSGTPYGGFHLGERGLRAFSSGVRYDLGAGLGLRLEATRRETTLRSPSYTIGIRGRIKLK